MIKLATALLACCFVLQAQRPVQVSGGVGYATFIDESDQSHFTGGGAARFYLTRRNAIEPEVLSLYRNATDKDLILGVNYVRDLARAQGRVTPYAIAGAGYLWGFRSRFTETTGTLAGGVGARVFLGNGGRYFVSPELRMGTEPILRVQVSFGWASAR